MTYAEAIKFIESTEKFGIKPGLDAIGRLLHKLGNPQNALKVVHIAGTNGKGSTASFIKGILVHAGYRVGFYTSPSLYSYEERIQINNENITEKAFAEITEKVSFAAMELVSEGYEPNTEFEIFTAMAMLYFYEMGTDFVVLEVGLGGRLDATNVVDKPLVSVITPIALDHVNILGDTLEKVAFEKGGIIKDEVPLVIHPQQVEASKVLEDLADKHNSDLIVAPVDLIEIESISLDGTRFNLGARTLSLSMIGAHQAQNAVVALTAAEVLRREYDVHISEEAIELGLLSTHWPCRLELLKTQPQILLDGAHNPHGANALKEALQDILDKDKGLIIIIGMLADKDVDEVLSIMKPYFSGRHSQVIVTEPKSDRKMPASELREKLKQKGVNAEVIEDPKEALASCVNRCNEDDLILAFGSFYLVGRLRQEALHDYIYS